MSLRMQEAIGISSDCRLLSYPSSPHRAIRVTMQTVDEAKLESDPQYRYDYLAEFIGFGADDVKAIQTFAPHLGPRIGELVDKT